MSPTWIIESRTPNPVSTSAVQLPTPISIIIMRALYRNMLRSVTFRRKGSRFHRGRIFSIQMRLPGFADFGRTNAAGELRSSLLQENHTLRDTAASDTPKVRSAIFVLNTYGRSAKSYSVLYAHQKIFGSPQVPTGNPTAHPIKAALPA